jgi:invasion protein IalB
MGYRTSDKHALNGPPTALLRISAQSRSLSHMPASRHASAAGKCAETTAVVMALTILIAAAQSARAEQAPEGAPAAWRVECVGDGKTLDCRAVQQVFHRETRQLVVSALVRPAPDGKSAAMIITLPLGLNLTEPVSVKVDTGTAERQSIQTCTNVGCFVAMTLTDKLIAAMRAGSDLKITVQDANKKPIEMSLPLLGFGIAFDKAK